MRNKSTTVKTSVKRAAAGALIGAVLGGVVGGGHGAAIGAAVGASIGATTTLATRGPDLEFKEGTQFTVECSGPTNKRNQPSRATTSESAIKPANAPDQPSRTFRTYSAKLFSLTVPDNWQENSGANELSFVPDRGYSNFQGRRDVTHGAMVGISPLEVQDLKKASEQLVGLLSQANPDFHREGSLIQETIANRNALSAVLSGISRSTARVELVTVHCALLNGKLFYLITVVPQDESASYREAFDALLRSVQFNN